LTRPRAAAAAESARQPQRDEEMTEDRECCVPNIQYAVNQVSPTPQPEAQNGKTQRETVVLLQCLVSVN